MRLNRIRIMKLNTHIYLTGVTLIERGKALKTTQTSLWNFSITRNRYEKGASSTHVRNPPTHILTSKLRKADWITYPGHKRYPYSMMTNGLSTSVEYR